MKKKTKPKGVSIGLVITIVITIFISTIGITGYLYYKEKYRGSAVFYSKELIKNLPEKGLEKNIAKLFYSEEEIKFIKDEKSINLEINQNENSQDENSKDDGIIIHKIKGPTYQAIMMEVKNPEDVIVAINPNLDSSGAGLALEDYIELHDGIAGINAGGFEDAGGSGNGGQAWGIVISDGKLVSGHLNDFTSVIGINYDNKLVVGDMSAKQALEWNIRDAVTFGPIFIDQFQVVFKSGRHPGLNPRTVIGQKEDGTFLLLVIDGRQPVSLGSTYQDIIDIMLDFNAMTAANLDGGNSTVMVYDGKTINSTVSIYGARNLPTAFIVKKGSK
ncbi:MAG: phosphodiester glycosidase family protein [Erysipelotrichaceae bacterium]|nr:phosphodiester glycosidase family protein [Erysipelotrichaceae bacterium]